MEPRNLTPMVLAAGYATRLRPLTADVAKAVVPFLNRPLLDHTLEWLARAGFSRVVINLHHAGESVVRRYGHSAFGLSIDYSQEAALLGTAGGPRKAIDLLEERVLLVNGDVVGLMSIGALVRHHEATGALATLALYRGSAAAGYPQVAAAATGELLAFPGDDSTGLPADTVRGVFTGLQVIERSVLEQLPEGRAAGIVDPLYRQMLAGGHPLHAVAVPGAWYEVGDPMRYIDNQLASLRLGDVPLGVQGYQRVSPGGYKSVDSHLENVRLVPPYLAGPGVRLRHGARLQSVVLGDRTRVGAACNLDRVVTWRDSWIGPNCRLRNVVVMEGVHVPSRTEVSDVVFTAAGAVPFATAARSVS